MPLARYFLYVGAVLLALLLVVEAYVPKLPAMERAHANLPLIRIHSDRKWPQRIVYDTSLPAGISSAVAALEPDVQSGAMSEDISFGPNEREAFAQMRSSNAEQLQRTVSGSQEHARQSRRKYARKGMSKLAMARPSQFGWFGKSFW
jgi:hypothetical protein